MSRPRRQNKNRSLRKTGPGGQGGASGGGSRRRITITSAGPTGDVTGSSPTIRATVEDREGSLSRRDIDVYLDGKEMRFTYGRSSGSLKCATGKLSSGTHTVEIEANAADGEQVGQEEMDLQHKEIRAGKSAGSLAFWMQATETFNGYST